jgi:hypothetical protein
VPRLAHSNIPSCTWIRTLAAPYLRGYRAVAERRGGLRGYRFFARSLPGTRARCGFFVGYLLDPARHEFLKSHPPECIVFAFVEPVSSALYRSLVTSEKSLLRRTAEYISWLTHRPPRFAFFEDQETVLVRHFSMVSWPVEKRRHYSGNFFIETLAWLVRSGLVKKLRPEQPGRSRKARTSKRKK